MDGDGIEGRVCEYLSRGGGNVCVGGEFQAGSHEGAVGEWRDVDIDGEARCDDK